MHKAKHAKSSRGILVLIGLVLCLAVGIQGTLAYLHTQTDPVVNTFEPSKVSCEVTEDFNGTTKKSIAVKNIGDTDAYVRVALVSYRVNEADNVIGGEAPVTLNLNNSNWVKYGDYYYCKTPIAAGAKSADLLADELKLEDYGDGEHQVIEVHAEAIQSTPASAVTEAWGETVANLLNK